MKKAIFIGALGVFALASCKKDYTCECTSSVGGVSTGTSSITINDTKKKAKDACEATGASASIGGVTSSTTCELAE